MALTDLDSDDPIQDLSRALSQWTLFAGMPGLLQTITGREHVCPRMTVNPYNHFRRNRFPKKSVFEEISFRRNQFSKKPFFEEIVFEDREECIKWLPWHYSALTKDTMAVPHLCPPDIYDHAMNFTHNFVVGPE